QSRFATLLADHGDKDHLHERLLAAERRNLGRYGYGVKAFVLSMIETAIEVTDAKVPAQVISELIEAGREMLACPIDLLPHARDAVEMASQTHRVLLITKGDLLDQERKLAQSGLGDLFDAVEIVSDKTPAIYATIFARHGNGSGNGLMVGDSMRSDVVAMIDSGGWGVFVPHGPIWELEHAEPPHSSPRFHEIADLGGLADVLTGLG
ncbi:MAG: HAD family hydrolase, partial [Rhodobacteraceae bacterium]|nr:HAD family hydrolase [Paracoccaceae bacterium]